MGSAGQSTKSVVLKLSVLPSEAIRGIQDARKALETYIAANKQLEAIGRKNSDRYISNETAIKNLNTVIAQNQKLLQDSVNQQKSQNDSLNALRAQLAGLTKQYDDLSKTERESAKGVDMLKHIQELTDEISEIEQNTKRFQRNVGNYGDALNAAINGTLPMKTAMREIKQELVALTVQYRESAGAIQGQKAVIEQIAQTQGKESQAYKDAVAEMDAMIDKRDEMKQQMDDMTKKAGQLDDAITDVNNAIKNAGTDNAPLVAAKQSADLLMNSYTALHGTLVALGIEDKNLIEIYAKLQIIQKGLNAMTQIYNLLQKESVLRQQLNVLWTNLTTKSLGSLIAAKKGDAAASATATAGNTALTGSEMAATGAAFTLRGALEALKTAMYNIPIIGWIVGAAAALAGLIALVVKINKEEDMGAGIKEQILETDRERVNALEDIHNKQQKIKDDISGQVELLGTLDKNSRAYKDSVDEIAKYLGVSNEYVEKHKDELGEVIEAQAKSLELQEQMEENDKAAEEAEKNKRDLISETNAVMEASYERSKQLLEEMVSSGKITEDQQKRIAKIRKQVVKGEITSLTAENLIKGVLGEQIKGYDTLISKSKTLNANLNQQLKETQKIVFATQTDSDKTTKIKSGGSADNAKERRKKELEERRKTEDMELKMVKDGLEKQLLEYRRNLSRQIEDLKERLKTEKNLTTKAKEEINRQITLLSAKQVTDEMNIRKKYNDDYLKQQLSLYKQYYKSVADSSSVMSDANLKARLGLMKLDFDESVRNLKQSVEKINSEYTQLDEIFAKTGKEREDALKSMGMTEEEFMTRFGQVTLDWNNATDTYTKTLANMEVAYNQSVTKVVEDFNKARRDLGQELIDTTFATQWQQRLNDLETGMFADKEVKKAEIAQEMAERRVQIAKDEAARISKMTEKQYVAEYGNAENWNLAIQKSILEVAKTEGDLQKAVKDTNAAVMDQKKQMVEAGMTIADAMASTAGSLNNLFNTLAENNEKYSDFATGMAMAQILISTAVSIAQAVQAAVQAGGFTGPAAPVTIPVFIAELIGIVASSIASAVSTLKQAKNAKGSAPKFAEGGLITEGGDSTGKRDSVHIMASTGEYVIKKKAVDNVGVDFLDMINNFDGKSVSRKSGYYAVGGEVMSGISVADESVNYERMKASFAEALEEMPNPVVSVKEITNKQKRVAVKERIANQ